MVCGVLITMYVMVFIVTVSCSDGHPHASKSLLENKLCSFGFALKAQTLHQRVIVQLDAAFKFPLGCGIP